MIGLVGLITLSSYPNTNMSNFRTLGASLSALFICEPLCKPYTSKHHLVEEVMPEKRSWESLGRPQEVKARLGLGALGPQTSKQVVYRV